MTDTAQTPPAADAPAADVLIFHTGKGHGPMHTHAGVIAPGASLKVPAALAKKLTGAYAHIKLAKDVIPGGVADPAVAAERDALKRQVAELEGQLEAAKNEDSKELLEVRAQFDKSWEGIVAEKQALSEKLALAEAGDKAALQAAVRDFLACDSKKALEALQAKHKDIVA